MKDKNKSLVVVVVLLVLIAVAGIIYFFNKKENSPLVAPPDTNAVVSSMIEQGEVCYYKETMGEQTSDYAFTSINYGENGEVHGIINWIPGEKDSLVGAYTGMLESNNIEGYPLRLNVIYAGAGEGIVSYQQEIIIVGDSSRNNIKTGIGEKYLDNDGVYKFKDINKLVFGNELPRIDCNSVPERFKTDYSMSK